MKQFNKNLFGMLFACMTLSQGIVLFGTKEQSFQLRDDEKRQIHIDALKKEEEQKVVQTFAWAHYPFGFMKQAGTMGQFYRFMWDNAFYSLATATFYAGKDLITRGILNESQERLVRYIKRYCLTSPLVKESGVPEDLYLDDLVLNPNIHAAAEAVIGSFKNSSGKMGRVRFNGLLFCGLPGTGKTELAKTIASEIDRAGIEINYYLLSGNKLAQAKLEDLEDFIGQLQDHRQLTIVVIDECETFLAARIGNQKQQSKGIFEWLEFTSKPSPYIQFIYMTNYAEKIDFAMHRRMKFIEFEYPDLASRVILLQRYLNKEFLSDPEFSALEKMRITELLDDTTLIDMAKKLAVPPIAEGPLKSGDVFSPANIETIMVDMKSHSIGLGHNGVPTPEIINMVIDEAISRKKREISMNK